MSGSIFGKPAGLYGILTPKKKRKPIPKKIKTEKMTKPRKCGWCRKQPVQEIHHVDGNPSHNNRRNLIGLCGTCHLRATRGEITKEQLRKRLGFKTRKRKSGSRRKIRKRKSGSSVAEVLLG